MNDKTDFSFSFSVGQKAAPKTKDTEDLIALDACKVYRLPQDRLLVRNARTGNSTTIRADVFSALTLCEAFRTPDEHVAELVKRMGAPPDQVGQIRKVINDSLDRGLLVSSTDICQALTAGKVSEGDTGSGDLGAAVVVVITWERPAALERLLDSIHDNADPDNFHHLYVVDDSRKSENIARNQDVMSAFAEKREPNFRAS